MKTSTKWMIGIVTAALNRFKFFGYYIFSIHGKVLLNVL